MPGKKESRTCSPAAVGLESQCWRPSLTECPMGRVGLENKEIACHLQSLLMFGWKGEG